ncbi:MAG: hypothetical protein ACXWQQ_09975 [Pseudobdellovibrio sp.]
MLYRILIPVALLFLLGCSSSSTKPAPEWVASPTRLVDNGYIVYVGRGEGMALERAQFKAEGQALEDLANECSMIPKGTRIEDRYSDKTGNVTTAYAKIGVEFQECEEMKKSIRPEDIRKNANAAFVEQLKRYQDLSETGELVSSADSKELAIPENYTEPPPQAKGMSDSVHFYLTRQYVVYQKEVVVLTPPQAFAPTSPESKNFVTHIEPVVKGLAVQEASLPELRNQPTAWSRIIDKPHIERPGVLTAAAVKSRQFHTMAMPKAPPAMNMKKSKRRGGKQSALNQKKKKKKIPLTPEPQEEK